MDVILNLKHPRVELTIPVGSSIARDLIYEQAGLTARDSSGTSLMSQIHLGPDGVYDAGFTPDTEGEHIVSSFFETGGRFYNIGKDITLVVRYEQPEPVATAEPVDFGFEIDPVVNPVEPVIETQPVASTESKLTLIRQDGNTYTYELDNRLGDNPGLYRIPDLDQVIEVPEGKEFVEATLVVYPTYSNGDPVEQIELANGATFHSPHIQWSSVIEDEMPFGIDDGSDIYGIWYGLIATLRDIPKPEPKSAWGSFAKPKAAPAAPVEEQPAPSPWAQAVQSSQPRYQEPEPDPEPEEPSGLGNIWDDEPRLDEEQGYTAPIAPHPELQETRRFDTTALRTAPEFNFETDNFDYEQPQLATAHDSPEEEFEPAPATAKKGLFGKKASKADKPAKPAKAPKPAKNKRAKKPGAKKGKGGLIAAVVGGLSVIGLAVGGFFYYQAGVKAAEPLKTEITATNKEISTYLDKSEISSEDTTALAALVQKNDDAFNAFKPGNFIAQQKENELIRETQELIDKVYAKLNG